jgi:hypothetical protein
LNRIEKFLLTGLNKTRAFIRRHPDIIIVGSDKSKKTIAMYQCEYDSKVTDLLSDIMTYEIIPVDILRRVL